MRVIVNKLLTTYTEIGNGPNTILFLHGWADSGKTFEMLAKEIVAINTSYSALLLDLPGFGGSDGPPEAWGLPEYASFTADFLKKTGKDPLAIIGHSNGGAIAIHGLAQNILTTSKLILIGSAGIRDKNAKKKFMRLLAKPAKLAIKATPKPTQKRIRQKLYSAIGSDYLVMEHMQETFKKVVSYDVRAEAKEISIPVCLIYGENDSSTPPAYGKLLSQAMPDAKLHTIPLAGHFVHQEQVYKVAGISTAFLNGNMAS